MMTARKRVRPLPVQQLSMRHSVNHSSSDSSSRHSLSGHSSPDLSSTSAGPSRKRRSDPYLGGESRSRVYSHGGTDTALSGSRITYTRILSAPKARNILINDAVRKGERLMPPSALNMLLRVTFPSSSARIKATERLEAMYPTLKEVALAGSPGSKAMKQVFQQIYTVTLKASGEVIMEYLVKLTKRHVFRGLNKDILKITVLTTNTSYPSRKIRRIYACTH
nr:transmembrane protein 214-like [Tanacetum cinerariifolium]